MRTRFVAYQQFFVDVELHNMHFECISVHILAEGSDSCTMPSICTGHSARRGGFTHSDSIGVSRSDAEFVRLITIGPLKF